jgi:hypothetical protein
MGDSDNLRPTRNHRADICLCDSGIISGDTCHGLLPAARNWTEETLIQWCKASRFEHDNHSFKRVNAEPLTFEDRSCYGRNRSESL